MKATHPIGSADAGFFPPFSQFSLPPNVTKAADFVGRVERGRDFLAQSQEGEKEGKKVRKGQKE